MLNTPVIDQSLRLVTEDGDRVPAVARGPDRVNRLALDQPHATALVADAPDLAPVPARGPASVTALALDWLHRNTASAFLAETSPELSALATDSASALGLGTDRERADARIRLAARMVAVGRVQEQTLELALAAALDRRDDAGITMLNRVLDGVSKRTHRWLEEHRLSCSAGQRSVAVAVNAIGNVTINGER